MRGEYIGARQVDGDAIGALPADATLRDMDARRSKAAEPARDALDDQKLIAAELVENAHEVLDWANGVLDSVDFSDGLDGMDREALTRVFDRAVIRGDKARAIAAAQLLNADGDTTAMPRLSANYDGVRVALESVHPLTFRGNSSRIHRRMLKSGGTDVESPACAETMLGAGV